MWDGNEVWLLVAGGATFAAFPEWYATMFSGFYLALTLILVALIVRVMALEYRNKQDDPVWRRPLGRRDRRLQRDAGPAVGRRVREHRRRQPAREGRQLRGQLPRPAAPLHDPRRRDHAAAVLLHGAHFLALRTEGAVRERAHAAASRLWLPTVVVVAAFAVWTLADAEVVRPLAVAATAVAAVALVAVIAMHRSGREGAAFGLTTVAIAGAVVLLFATLYPNVMVSSGPGPDLSIAAAASTHRTLVVMTVVALVMTPIVLALPVLDVLGVPRAGLGGRAR